MSDLIPAEYTKKVHRVKDAMADATLTIEQVLTIRERMFNGRQIPCIDARKVWRWLEVNSEYVDWIERRIEEYAFLEGTDWNVVKNNDVIFSHIPKSKDYDITLDMAKQLCMLEKTPRGHATRLWFIARDEELEQLKREQTVLKAFLLPVYDHDADCLYKQELFVQISRVYGFPAPRGSQHSPGCRGVVALYINGILPPDVQDVLYDTCENPYGKDGKTRKERHWRRLLKERHGDVLLPRIAAVQHVLYVCDDNAREEFKGAMARHDQRNGITLRVSPRVSVRLHASYLGQTEMLFDAVANVLTLGQHETVSKA